MPATVAGPAEALLQSPNAMIARTVDAALRRSIPASNSDVQQIQTKLEVCRMDNSCRRTVRKSVNCFWRTQALGNVKLICKILDISC